MVDSFGKYELIRKLGAGGMAEVYLARARGIERWNKLVAIKRILPHMVEDAVFVQMFLDEARLAAQLHHPNVAQVHDIGKDGDSYFFTMEYLPGHDMSGVMKAAYKAGAGLSRGAAIAVVLGVAAGLHHAHEQRGDDGSPLGIVHRDVTPSNVLVSDEGAVKVLDFGIAKAATRQMSTRTGALRGKIPYMSPEQTRGLPLDRRSDVFALGILLYEFTTWRRLFKGDNDLQILQRIGGEDAPPPSRVVADYPPALEAIVMRALQRDRELRYQTAEELQAALEDFARDHKIATTPRVLAEEMRRLFPAGEDTEPAIVALPPTELLVRVPVTPAAQETTTAIEIATETRIDTPVSQTRVKLRPSRWPLGIALASLTVIGIGAAWALDDGATTEAASPAAAVSATPTTTPEVEPPTIAVDDSPAAQQARPDQPPAPSAQHPRRRAVVKPPPPRRKAAARVEPRPAKKTSWDPNSPFLPEE